MNPRTRAAAAHAAVLAFLAIITLFGPSVTVGRFAVDPHAVLVESPWRTGLFAALALAVAAWDVLRTPAGDPR